MAFRVHIVLLAYTSLYAHSLCLFIAGRQQHEPDPDSWPEVAAMNDLITAYEIVCYKVNAVHYLKQSQGTNMVKLNHAHARAWLFFLGEEWKGSAAVILERPADCRNCKSAWAEMMIPLSGPQREPSTTKMERSHQKHLQWQQWLSFRGVTRITTWRPCKNVIYYGSFFAIVVFEKQNSATANSL